MKQKLILCTFIITSLLFVGCTQSNNQKTESNTISEQEARDIALSHAGLSSDQATFIKSHIDIDDGKQVYDVEFYTPDGKEYDYEINPESGTILDFDFDVENFMD